MTISQAVSQLLEIEELRNTGILSPNQTLGIAMSRVGGGERQRTICGTLAELVSHPSEAFGEPLHSLIIVGKRLHPLEVEYAGYFAIDKQRWQEVAKTAYGCDID